MLREAEQRADAQLPNQGLTAVVRLHPMDPATWAQTHATVIPSDAPRGAYAFGGQPCETLCGALASTGQCTTPDVAHRFIPSRALLSEGRRPKRDQRSGVPVWRASISSVSFSAGVRKPSVWRGRPLSLRATSSSSA